MRTRFRGLWNYANGQPREFDEQVNLAIERSEWPTKLINRGVVESSSFRHSEVLFFCTCTGTLSTPVQVRRKKQGPQDFEKMYRAISSLRRIKYWRRRSESASEPEAEAPRARSVILLTIIWFEGKSNLIWSYCMMLLHSNTRYLEIAINNWCYNPNRRPSP